MKNYENLIKLYEDSISNNWSYMALSDYGGSGMTYRECGEKILKLHSAFKALGINKGDKIALIGKNSANWGVIYLAVLTYGAVIVPILPDFKATDLQTIVNHSDSRILFLEDSFFQTINSSEMPALIAVLDLGNFSVYHTFDPAVKDTIEKAFQKFHSDYPEGIQRENILFAQCTNDDIALISYTSGTTGFSKGVVLQHKSLLGNMNYARNNMPLNPGDKILSFLPLAHTYGCAFEFLFPFTLGCHITFLTKTPSPNIILEAFGEIKPALILSVPLVIDKIYKVKLLPVINKTAFKILTSIPGIRRILFNTVRKKVYASFGGNFRELVIGGAAFNPEAERFFKKIRFPFTVGYGMTECGPLISYSSWETTALGASGKIVDELEIKIDSTDPLNIVGEILVRGNHVMLGYYKNDQATQQIIDSEGWLHTGDLGVIDKQKRIFIKGRCKSMILSQSGQNIYPDEIESLLNNMLLVMESVVVERENKLIALIYPDHETMKKLNITEDMLPSIFKTYIHTASHKMPKYMSLANFEIQTSEFEKTPKRSIKRYLYQ